MTESTLTPAPPAAKLAIEIMPAAALADVELSDAELEAVVGGLARVHFPAIRMDAAA